MNESLRDSWQAMCGRLAAGAEAAGMLGGLLLRYREPHRAYHNLEHIAECLALLVEFRALARRPDLMELAIWFHDAVYDPRAADNEERSAALAREFCRVAALAPDDGDAVEALILATKTHSPGDLADARLLVDIDLSILGQAHERYARYELAIREEYAWVSRGEFVAGRSSVLEKFLSRERIYFTPALNERFEARARENLRWALERLGNSHGVTAPSSASGGGSR